MFNEFINFLSEFRVIFSFSFLVALTGAMAPGPLLTYTIIKSAKTNRRGYLMGLWIITGHAILEMGIIILLLLGFSFVLKNIAVVRIIGVSGGLILILFGASIIRDIFNGNISADFLNSRDEPDKNPGLIENKGIENPVIGGIMVSMSNPYWWVWWATIGFAFMIQFNISFKNWPKLLAFFLGHEAGDLIWYLLVSTLAFFGLRHMNLKAYYGILMFCALFMVLFGIYLGISPFLKNSV
ncbi:MAG: LysE family transporter [Deltaproteobacteria bacterium]|nr:LysE family transporter [Deltaproteobacteria bacterium]